MSANSASSKLQSPVNSVIDLALLSRTTALVMVHDNAGTLLSFQWPEAIRYGFNPLLAIGKPLEAIFDPPSLTTYQEALNFVFEQQCAKHISVPLQLGQYTLAFDFCLSPVVVPSALPQQVVSIGALVKQSVENQPQNGLDSLALSPACAATENYYAQLNRIAWNIRRTLDLETIWQQTVDGLGAMLSIDNCLICSFQEDYDQIKVEAEYAKYDSPCCLHQVFGLEQVPYLQKALRCLHPVLEESGLLLPPHRQMRGIVLAIATCYQDQPNGLILLFRQQPHQWTSLEVESISELADQVGTAIAHASLFSESHSLAVELQRVNEDLLEKHHELEEARSQAEEARQQAEEISRLKSEFLANTSHELRTPLNGMIGFLKLVLDGMADDPAEQEEFVREAHNSALHLLNLINDVLDIAKIEAGKMQLDMAPVNLRELFQNVDNFTRHLAEQKGLHYEILMPETRDEIVLNGNYQRLLQVMLNVVGNAIKFTHEGYIRVSAEVKRQKVKFQNQEWPGTVKISVADTGIGVSLEKQDRLFQTFSQVDGERTRQYGGTGLGLAISQKLVEAMGGVVQFISMGEGLGSTVTFTALLYQEPVVVSPEPIAPIQ
ncbi:ATP-binding protein [Almyronema epifaneia]|uniref:histidine kinase n=1 Tax=Almyronema epifaneia S1 TaxID=2991925 RepID=A0ABW6IB12_9CYAN